MSTESIVEQIFITFPKSVSRKFQYLNTKIVLRHNNAGITSQTVNFAHAVKNKNQITKQYTSYMWSKFIRTMWIRYNYSNQIKFDY